MPAAAADAEVVSCLAEDEAACYEEGDVGEAVGGCWWWIGDADTDVGADGRVRPRARKRVLPVWLEAKQL